MLYLDPHRIIEARIAESMRFDKYKMIIEHVRKVDVSADLDCQRTYNGFYRIRRNAEWRAAYYGLFEEIKRKGTWYLYAGAWRMELLEFVKGLQYKQWKCARIDSRSPVRR